MFGKIKTDFWSIIKIIICKIDPKISYKRYMVRKEHDPLREYFHGDPPLLIENNDVYEYINIPEPTIEVETINSYNPSLSKIRSFISDETDIEDS